MLFVNVHYGLNKKIKKPYEMKKMHAKNKIVHKPRTVCVININRNIPIQCNFEDKSPVAFLTCAHDINQK